LLGDAMVSRTVWLAAAGVGIIIYAFAKSAEPLIEVGIAFLVMAWFSNPKPKS
jgi:hypothetical protein